MDYLSVFMTVFSVIGAVDLIFGNRLGIGKEFEKGFVRFGSLATSMIGMIVIAPVLEKFMQPLSVVVYNYLHIDPSLIPAMILGSDMGGYVLADTMAQNEVLGCFNGLLVAAMMGCTVSYTIPVALSLVKPENHRFVMFGFLCGVITIPVGCFVSGIIIGIGFWTLVADLLPMIIFSVIIAGGLIFFPQACIKIFGILGNIIKGVIIAGLILGIIKFMTGIELIKGLADFEDGADICVKACVVMSGTFPLVYIVSRIINKPLNYLSRVLNINKHSAVGFISSLATSVTTFSEMEIMDKKGIVLNSAFAISAAFTFAGYLAFVMTYRTDFVMPGIIGKLISGVSAVLLALVMYKKSEFNKGGIENG